MHDNEKSCIQLFHYAALTTNGQDCLFCGLFPNDQTALNALLDCCFAEFMVLLTNNPNSEYKADGNFAVCYGNPQAVVTAT